MYEPVNDAVIQMLKSTSCKLVKYIGKNSKIWSTVCSSVMHSHGALVNNLN